MKVIIFGATGSIGRLTVKSVLKDGHEVTAFARNPQKLGFVHEKLTLFSGDAFKKEDVSAALSGHDAVIITLGSGMARKNTIRSQGTMAIIQAMQAHGIDRLICQSTLGAHESWANLNFFWKRIMFGALLRPVFLDHELQEKLVRVSGLKWTLVRPSAFKDNPVSDLLKQGFDEKERRLKLIVSRQEVADFLKKQLYDTKYCQSAVALSY